MSNRLALLLALTYCLHAATPDETYRALRTNELKESFTVENLVIKRDAGILTLKSGTIALTAPIQGRDTLAVFSGDAEFAFDPPLGIEKVYLKQQIEKDTIQESFDRAVFLFTDDTGKEIRAQGKSRPVDAKLADQ